MKITLKRQINKELKYIPDFIDGKKKHHKAAYGVLQDVYELVKLMAYADYFMTDAAIVDMTNKIDDTTDILLNSDDYILNLHIWTELSAKVEWIKEVLLENEVYEGLQNISKFEKIYIKSTYNADENDTDMNE